MFSDKALGTSSRSAVNLWQKLLVSTGIRRLFHLITRRLRDIEIVNDSVLWEQGAGLALPLQNKDDAGLIRRAIRLQLHVSKRRLVSEIKVLFKCAVITRADGDGIDIMWAADWQYSEAVKEWALRLAREYPLAKWYP